MWTQLSDKDAREFLSGEHFAHLGCVLDGKVPYVVPVNYLMKGDSIYIHSVEGTKLEALRENPNACVQVERVRNPYNWKSAIAFGTFEEVEDPAIRSAVIDELLTYFRTLTPVEGLEAQRGPATDAVVFKVKIRKLTGVSEN